MSGIVSCCAQASPACVMTFIRNLRRLLSAFIWSPVICSHSLRRRVLCCICYMWACGGLTWVNNIRASGVTTGALARHLLPSLYATDSPPTRAKHFIRRDLRHCSVCFVDGHNAQRGASLDVVLYWHVLLLLRVVVDATVRRDARVDGAGERFILVGGNAAATPAAC